MSASQSWQVLTDDTFTAHEQMAFDENLAEQAQPAVRFFCWSPPGVSFGLKQPQPEWFDSQSFEIQGLEWVHRPTGGALALHGSDVSWSIVIPNAWKAPLEEWMRKVCACAVALCADFGVEAKALLDAPAAGRVTYCLAETSPYAIMVGQRKVMGFAIRRFPNSWLVQASLLVEPVPGKLRALLPESVLSQYSVRAIALSEASEQEVFARAVQAHCAQHWQKWWDQS